MRVRTHDGVSPAATIDARACAHLDPVPEHDLEQLRLLVHSASLIDPEAEPIGTDPDTAVQQAMGAHTAVLERHVGVQLGRRADVDTSADDATLADLAPCSDVCVLQHNGSPREQRARVHVRGRVNGRCSAQPSRYAPHASEEYAKYCNASCVRCFYPKPNSRGARR